MQIQLGKETLGSGKKMTVNLRNFDRSTHDKSYAWRSTMGVATLVPCMKLVSVPGDTWDIDIDARVFTNPTVGPLFGEFKLQVDVFKVPIRLYIAQLHNNTLGIAQNMSNVKLPQLQKVVHDWNNPDKDNPFKEINPSCILTYLGWRGNTYVTKEATYVKNGVPLLGYWDIFANYYCNKQEKNFYMISNESKEILCTDNLVYKQGEPGSALSGSITINYSTADDAATDNCGLALTDGTILTKEQWTRLFTRGVVSGNNIKYNLNGETALINRQAKPAYGIEQSNTQYLKSYDIEMFNNLRELILSRGKEQILFNRYSSFKPIAEILNFNEGNKTCNSQYPQAGLAIKTYQNDIFTNFVNTERVEAITNKTKVSTASGSFSIDTLNLSQKIYNLQNRLAASNGTYKDYIEVAYTQDYGLRTETPMYEGGYSDRIVFEEVVNTAQSEDNPLGVIGGKGRLAGAKKGGKLHINVDEPCYIMGIVSITPLIDYSEGNDWDTTLDNMGQLHVPELDGIGYEDLKLQQVAYWCDRDAAYAKTTAWQNYMTNYNKVYGDFVAGGSMAHMVLNRYFATGTYNANQAATSTYINPKMYNYMFAVQDFNALNFQVQLGFGVEVRRKMSARIIPQI